MTHIADLAPISYCKIKGPIRAVGWLEASHAYPRGPVDPELRRRLLLLIERPPWVLRHRGVHSCSLCAAEGKIGPDRYMSQAVLLVPATDCVYECPIWIGHYVIDHSYEPPDEFRRAVKGCPEPGSDDFRKALVALLPTAFRAVGPSFFAKWDARQTLRPDPEYGSPEG